MSLDAGYFEKQHRNSEKRMIKPSHSGNAKEQLKDLKKNVEQAGKMNATISGSEALEAMSELVGKNILEEVAKEQAEDIEAEAQKELAKAFVNKPGFRRRATKAYEAWAKALIEAVYEAISKGILGKVSEATRKRKRSLGVSAVDTYGIRKGGWKKHLKTKVSRSR